MTTTAVRAQQDTYAPLELFAIDRLLTQDERDIAATVRKFVDTRLKPQVADWFESGSLPRELAREFGELGLLGMHLDGYGCAGTNAVSYGLACMELEAGDTGLRSFVSVQSSLVMYPIHAYGSEEQRKRWLPALAKAEAIGCFGLTEAHGGSDPLNMNTTARRRGGDWVINGSKMWITNAPLSDVAVVWALTEEGVRGFLLEKGMPGFSVQEIERKFSLRASATGALFFDDVVVPEASMLPGSTVGLKAPLSCLTQARFGISWGVLGAAQACLDEALRHTKERVLFGRPLAATQAVQIRLAEMARKIAVGESLAMHLARRKDKGILTPVQVSLAKWNNCRSAIEVAREARDLLGGAGILAEYAPIRHALNLESVITYEGTETVHQLSLGRALTGLNAF